MVKRFARDLCGAAAFVALLTAHLYALPEESSLTEVAEIVTQFKQDPRGPYEGIRWFCPDGTILPAQDRCSQPGGIQHALPKKVVGELEQAHQIYLGQILAGTEFSVFFDARDHYSRAKQYQIEKYLQAVDDGWILRRARFYRGALQAEDEAGWSERFLTWLIGNDEILTTQFFLVRQIAKDLPRADNDSAAMRIRALAANIASEFLPFMEIRIKIHGSPDPADVERVKEFRKRYQQELPADVDERLQALRTDLESAYAETGISALGGYLSQFPVHTPVGYQIRKVVAAAEETEAAESQSRHLAHLLYMVRKDLTSRGEPEKRLALVDLSIDAEALLFRVVASWTPKTVRELLAKNYILAKAAAGCGFIEIWEWEFLEPKLYPMLKESVVLEDFLTRVEYSLHAVEWGAGTVRAMYGPEVETFSLFEPIAQGFIEDRTRSSVLLALGEVAAELADLAARFADSSNRVLDIPNQSQVRGLNPGIAIGQLEVVTGYPEGIEFATDKIYMLLRAPADLKPVAGIATVSEGNAVSHVQLLARNLGIPNAVISSHHLQDLARYSGTRVFYAVSPRGRVVIKPISQMTSEERALVESWNRERGAIVLDTGRVDLSVTELVSLSSLRATDSGKVCGPKAANLGQLSALFPDNVPSGLVIPFGVFREHLDQTMPGGSLSYWQFMENVFDEIGAASGGQAEARVALRLAELREAIEAMRFLPGFERRLRERFLEVFGVEIGALPVFVRSDTNMEDLQDFTGAGLNLTVGNIRSEADIRKAIQKVWASPFTERSYLWRQSALQDPENVFPSVLLLPSVNVDKSGVMITTGLGTEDPADVTVAFNWGGSGAVEGQAAETYLLRGNGQDVLLTPAREPEYNYFLPEGGIGKAFVTFNEPILNRSERFQLRQLAMALRRLLPGTPGIRSSGPFDVELGFWNESLWLFQVRPFVENKKARSSAYLTAMDGGSPAERLVSLNEPLSSLRRAIRDP